ncbi:polysaccharide biosynthesis/export family protein [Rhizobium cremeum]|uniref:polysaccharide biosynthesis/export family protein n=1 Tax=Rhizobium cremeum TaxID=2813827 RepID=UPI001FCF8869|nr:polysaccharide biosynthesis/export family protein [Rhizobium cremeum]
MLQLVAVPNAIAASDDGFRLRPQTRVKVSIVEWVASTGEYKEWTALNGEYSVSPLGTISVPLIGELVVANETTSEVADRIARSLREKTGLSSPPTATVEVIRYPMIYVSGAVDRPGEMEYRPGLTVMQAVAMAGGRERRSNPNGYSDLEQIRYAGELNRYDLSLQQLLARRARLVAELKESPKIDFPPELANARDQSTGRLIVESENTLFVARAEALKRQLDSLSELQRLLENEIKVLEEKSAVQERQVKIAQQELANISSLVETGTLAKSRETSLERVVADLNSGKLDLVVAQMRARQKVSETQRDAIALKGQFRTEAGRSLQEVEGEIDDTRLKRATTLQLLQASGASLSRYNAMKALEIQPMEYWITRRNNVRSQEKVQETAILEPGDVLDVRYDVSAGLGGAVQLSSAPEQSQ